MDQISVTSGPLTDDLVKRLNQDQEQNLDENDVLEGEVVDIPSVTATPASSVVGAAETAEKELRSRIESGEWDNLDDLPAFQLRTSEGQLMARTEAIDFRIRQLELRLPMLLNEHLHDAYIQVLKKIRALRKTKSALFYFFYKNQGQRDLGSGQ